MSDSIIKSFSNSDFGALNVFLVDGKEFFPATLCAKILGYQNPQKAIRDHCKGVNEMVTPTNGGIQKIKVIPEGDLYRMIVKSKLPSAEKFEKWIFDEVLPELRRTGSYGSVDIQTVIADTVKTTVSEVIKQLTPLLVSNIQQKSTITVVDNSSKCKRRKYHSIIEQLDDVLRRTVEEMICDPKCTYQNIVDTLADAGVSITATSIMRYSKRFLREEYKNL